MLTKLTTPAKSIPKNILKKLKQDRAWLHAHPEPAYKEFQTADYVRSRLESMGISYISNIAGTGIVAQIKGNGLSDLAIGLRADMDAVSIKEEGESGNPSVPDNAMHICGHDGHITILLGVAEVLSRQPDFSGTVFLIFQPAEEGFAGAKRMIEEGLFEQCPMNRIFALHNWPDLPACVIGSLKGQVMASSHYISITITGKGGHGGMPHQATPLMSIAAHIQLGINSYLAQQTNSLRSVVVSLTRIYAGKAVAVLPDSVKMDGAFRLFDDETTNTFYRDIPSLIKGIAGAFGAEAEIDLSEVYPATVNDESSTDIVRHAASKLGLIQRDESDGLMPSMASEDFSYMLRRIPGCYFWLGQSTQKDIGALHQSTYNFNDDTIETGVLLFAEIARTALPLGNTKLK